jgi:mono/diheme cytochrome c family protein
MRTVLGIFVVSLWLCAAACQPKSADSSSGPPSATPASTSGSKYDSGPRAGEQPVDDARAEIGEQLFKDKGCSACHAFGHKLTCPDLDGVTMRRTDKWIENQILHPEVMTKEDPIARGLFAQYALQMPNQKLTPEEARSVIEYLKHQNRETAERH